MLAQEKELKKINEEYSQGRKRRGRRSTQPNSNELNRMKETIPTYSEKRMN